MIRILTATALLALLGAGADLAAAEGGDHGNGHPKEHAVSSIMGTVQSVGAGGATVAVSVHGKGKDGKTETLVKTFTVTAATAIRIDGKAGVAADLKPGVEVHVVADGDAAKEIVAGTPGEKEHHKKKKKD